jgi:N-acetylmuramic acid 6-phosphate etherase
MVDVVATNDKLRDRVRRIVEAATGASSERAAAALDASDGDAKVAIVMLLADVDASTARERLAAADGVVRKALGQ